MSTGSSIIASVFSLFFLLLILWCSMMEYRDKQYRKKAKAGTPCRYWEGEDRHEGRIVRFKGPNHVVIRDFTSRDLVLREFKNTCAL